MSEALWSLIGVVVGFLLSEGTQWLKRRAERRELHTALFAELRSIVRMAPSKLDILSQAGNSFSAARLMPTESTHFPAQAYSRLISVAPDVLTPEASDCLHVLYESLRIVDETMDGLERRFNEIAEIHSVGQAVGAATGRIRDLESAIDTCQTLAQSVLDGTPINVYELQDGAHRAAPAPTPPPSARTQPYPER